jgi:CSLREA domain-containing protein
MTCTARALVVAAAIGLLTTVAAVPAASAGGPTTAEPVDGAMQVVQATVDATTSPPDNLPPGSVEVPWSIASNTQVVQDSATTGSCVQVFYAHFPEIYGTFDTESGGVEFWHALYQQASGTGPLPFVTRLEARDVPFHHNPEVFSTWDHSFGGQLGSQLTYYFRNGSTLPATEFEPAGVCSAAALAEREAAGTAYLRDNTRIWSDGPPGVNTAPVAGFTFEITDAEAHEVQLTNTSTDAEDDPLTYLWELGHDGETSTEVSPTHTFPAGASYQVFLTASDGESSDTHTQTVSFGGLVVNSTGDGAASDPATTGCDTGGTIGTDPECTLRAAIETANQRGGGEITFTIDAPEVPSITVESVLPALSASTVVDGTSQEPAGFVEVDGGTGFTVGFRLEGGTSRLTGLVLKEFQDGIRVSGGTGHIIEGNRFAVDSAGTAANGVLASAVVSGAPETEIRENVMRCLGCVVLVSGSDGSVVAENGFGIGPGDVVATAVGSAVGVFDAQVTIEDNVMRPADNGVLVQGPDAEGTVVSGNRIGVGAEGGGFSVDGEGIRISGAPGVEVLDNVVTSRSIGGVLVTGSVQTEQDDDGLILHPPSLTPVPGAVTGGGTVIRGNTIGLLADGATPSANVAPQGIVAWAGADGLTIESNTVANQSSTGISLIGGSGHTVVGNRLGVDATGSDPIQQTTGVQAYDTTGLTFGSASAGNVVRATDTSVSLAGSAMDATVTGNDLAGAQTGIVSLNGPDDPEEVSVTGLEISENTVDASQAAVNLDTPAAGAALHDNTLQGSEAAGVRVGDMATGTEVVANTILGANLGILNEGIETTIEDNRVGVDDGGTVDGGDGAGISTFQDLVADGNTVAGYTGAGIAVDEEAVATLTGNALYDIGGLPILTISGPEPPALTGALQTSTGDDTDRTLVILDGLPDEGTGTVEVFAGTDCGDPEARHVLDVTATKPPGRDYVVVPLIGRGDRNHFTATYTTTEEGTSPLSNCVERNTSPPDADGDGAPDPIEDLIGPAASDPATAAVISDTGDLLAVQTTEGTLAGVRAVDDPATGAHPAGFSLVYGTVSFEVRGLAQGGATEVRIAEIDTVGASDSYWKYGEQTAGAAPGWYRFTPDEATGTGASRGAVDLGPLGIVGTWTLSLVDGQRGDTGLFLDGTIRDPGGPGIVQQRFTDVTANHPFFDEIGWMGAQGVSTGYQPGPTYRPSAPVTRQAMSAFMYRLAGEPPFTPTGQTFTDVGASHPFSDEIEWMADTGISEGYPNGTYRPSAPVTRQAMSAFMFRLGPLLPT